MLVAPLPIMALNILLPFRYTDSSRRKTDPAAITHQFEVRENTSIRNHQDGDEDIIRWYPKYTATPLGVNAAAIYTPSRATTAATACTVTPDVDDADGWLGA
eukprot:GHVU01112476.1.p1 GENE.GHVU01112476.1~~GHVU01112476.1.p1  ORF type:complete len:102 (+),score=6.11 GHVU01112476.1:773-1078(+)